VDADVLQLVREERLLEAAHLCSDRGNAAAASALFERACDWRSAAAEALRAGEALRALELGIRGGDDAMAHSAAARVAAEPGGAERAAVHLAQRGHDAWAARVLEAGKRYLDAALAWERAGDLTRAAELFEQAGEPAHAARALESCLRRDPDAGEAAVALGALLLRFGKYEAGVRALQRVPARSPQRRAALTLLLGALHRLGWSSAGSAAAAELASLGGPLPPRDGPAEASALLYGRYDILGQVASSARARVLEGFDRARGERVALKVYAPGDARVSTRAAFVRLEGDIRALRPLDHPAIVPVVDLYPSGPTVVMAWMPGGTLEQMLAIAPIAPARAAEIASAIFSALGSAHRLGILHRDIKAANVLFDAVGAARLSDFGAAHAADASATITAGDLGLATQSPEQREGREVTARSDLFAVGVLLGEMLTGRASAPGSPPRPSAVHPDLDARHDGIVARLTARDPGARPADAFQAREMLLSLPWSGLRGATDDPARTAGDRSPSSRPGSERLEQRPDGSVVDRWTGRGIERVPLSDAALERARHFARAGHRALQPVLRVDREGGWLWLASCRAPVERPLTTAERERLVEALSALAAAGGPAPGIDPAALGVDPSGQVVVRFYDPSNSLRRGN
jgi:eukaryotic-like serine/threonine-protein kinase